MSASALPTGAAPAAAPVGARTTLAFFAMVLGMFMAVLDIQIVSASIADIQAGLGASADEASWVQTSYLIAEIVMIPLSGFLSRMLSTRGLFVISAIGFTVFSFACSLATSLSMMIAFRAAQGFLGGAMIPTVFAASFLLFPGAARVRATVIIGLTATLAPTLGPTLGGMLTNAFSWHALFLINVPVGLFIAVTVWLTLDLDKPDFALFRHFDWFGLALLAVFLGSLDYVLEEGARWQWLQDDTVATFAAIATVSGALFFWRSLTNPHPVVDLRAFTDRNFAIGSMFGFILGVALYGSVYLVPLFLGSVRGYDAQQIGETMFVTGVVMFVASPIVGTLSRRIDPRILVGLGLAVTGVAMLLTARLTNQSALPQLWFPLGLRGLGIMMVMVPVTTLALGTLPPTAIKNASGLYNLMRNFGGAFGLALINTMVIDRGAAHRLHLAEGMTTGRNEAVAMLAHMQDGMATRVLNGVDPDLVALRRLAMMVTREGNVLAYNDALLMMAAFFAAALPLVLLLRAPRAAGAPPPAH